MKLIKMSKVYVGTTNPVKLEAVKLVLSSYDVIGLDVASGVSRQPFSDEETIQGAKNRAENLPQGALRIGLEAGVQECMGILYLVNWGVLIDENDNYYYAGGTRIPLPRFVKEKLATEKKELAEIMDEYYHTHDIKHHGGAISFFTNSQVKRVDIFYHIVKLLYGQYLALNNQY